MRNISKFSIEEYMHFTQWISFRRTFSKVWRYTWLPQSRYNIGRNVTINYTLEARDNVSHRQMHPYTTKSEAAHKNLSVQGQEAQVSSDLIKHDDSITHLNNSHSQYHSLSFGRNFLDRQTHNSSKNDLHINPSQHQEYCKASHSFAKPH